MVRDVERILVGWGERRGNSDGKGGKERKREKKIKRHTMIEALRRCGKENNTLLGKDKALS